ncbi:MAG: hypothetical protein INQ03_06755 [Candidatus Heimdallarchaeota archaeon]|nr:hypothetical protein [Candidatus Heimdallarchaeota archaeon]
MRRYLFKVYYQGDKFTGFQRQPNGLAVENKLELAFIKSGFIESFHVNNYQSTSRTDAMVSAIENIFSLDMDHQPVITKINKFLPADDEIIIYAMAEVDMSFNVKQAKIKQYEYVINNPDPIMMQFFHRIYDFKGRHDYSSIIKKDGAGERNPITIIHDITYHEEKGRIIVKITGDRFGREQIRKIIGFLQDKKMYHLQVGDILDKEERTEIVSAPAGNLLLLKIEFEVGINWIYPPEIHKAMISKYRALLLDGWLSSRIGNYLQSTLKSIGG